jgi:hypothetical protein
MRTESIEKARDLSHDFGSKSTFLKKKKKKKILGKKPVSKRK